MNKSLFSVLCLLFSFTAGAQVVKVDLQASGLTCSMCSNAINKALLKLDFVDKVEPNIKNSSFDIRFKADAEVDFDKIRQKVEGAGFSVARFLVTMKFNGTRMLDDRCIFIGSTGLRFTNTREEMLLGERTFRVMDKGYVLPREWKKNPAASAGDCYQRIEQKETRVYHVILT